MEDDFGLSLEDRDRLLLLQQHGEQHQGGGPPPGGVGSVGGGGGLGLAGSPPVSGSLWSRPVSEAGAYFVGGFAEPPDASSAYCSATASPVPSARNSIDISATTTAGSLRASPPSVSIGGAPEGAAVAYPLPWIDPSQPQPRNVVEVFRCG